MLKNSNFKIKKKIYYKMSQNLIYEKLRKKTIY